MRSFSRSTPCGRASGRSMDRSFRWRTSRARCCGRPARTCSATCRGNHAGEDAAAVHHHEPDAPDRSWNGDGGAWPRCRGAGFHDRCGHDVCRTVRRPRHHPGRLVVARCSGRREHDPQHAQSVARPRQRVRTGPASIRSSTHARSRLNPHGDQDAARDEPGRRNWGPGGPAGAAGMVTHSDRDVPRLSGRVTRRSSATRATTRTSSSCSSTTRCCGSTTPWSTRCSPTGSPATSSSKQSGS